MAKIVLKFTSYCWQKLTQLLLKSKETVFNAISKMPMPSKIEHLRPKSLKDLNAKLLAEIFKPKNWTISEIVNTVTFLTTASVGIEITSAVSHALTSKDVKEGVQLMIEVNQAPLTANEKIALNDSIVAKLVHDGYTEQEIIEVQKASEEYLKSLKDSLLNGVSTTTGSGSSRGERDSVRERVHRFADNDEIIETEVIDDKPKRSVSPLGLSVRQMREELASLERDVALLSNAFSCSKKHAIEVAQIIARVAANPEDYKAL